MALPPLRHIAFEDESDSDSEDEYTALKHYKNHFLQRNFPPKETAQSNQRRGQPQGERERERTRGSERSDGKSYFEKFFGFPYQDAFTWGLIGGNEPAQVRGETAHQSHQPNPPSAQSANFAPLAPPQNSSSSGQSRFWGAIDTLFPVPVDVDFDTNANNSATRSRREETQQPAREQPKARETRETARGTESKAGESVLDLFAYMLGDARMADIYSNPASDYTRPKRVGPVNPTFGRPASYFDYLLGSASQTQT